MKSLNVMTCVVLSVLTGCVPGSGDNSQTEANAAAAKLEREADKLVADADNTLNGMSGSATTGKSAADESAWTYAVREDKMRGASGKTASVTSTDTLNLSSPYGETTPELTIRQDPKFGFDIYITSDGQPQCDEYSHPTVSVKFDDGPVRTWGCNGAADGSPGIVFFNAEKAFLAKLKTSKTLMVEVDYYDSGRQQFSFPVAGLKWD